MDFVWQQKGWPNATVARAALKDELAAFKDALSRARKLLRKPQDPEAVARALAQEAVETSAIEGVKAGLSASKWVRMAKVSKPTATRDLAELVAVGAIVRKGEGPTAHYRLDGFLFEPIEGINEGINDWLIRLVATHPGVKLPYLKSVVGKSTATVERAVAALVKAGRIEHRGSKKTGGYFAVR